MPGEHEVTSWSAGIVSQTKVYVCDFTGRTRVHHWKLERGVVGQDWSVCHEQFCPGEA